MSVDTASHLSVAAAECHKNRIVTKTQEAQEHKDEQSRNHPACPRKVPLPSEITTEPFGCHNIFRKAVFPLLPIVFFVTCHNSLPPPPLPPHPHPLSGAQIRSIPVSSRPRKNGGEIGEKWDTVRQLLHFQVPFSPFFLKSHQFPYRTVNKKVGMQVSGGKMREN